MGGPRCEGDKGHVPCPQGRPNPCTRGDRGWRRGTSALPSRSYHSTRIGGDRGEHPLHPKATPTLAHTCDRSWRRGNSAIAFMVLSFHPATKVTGGRIPLHPRPFQPLHINVTGVGGAGARYEGDRGQNPCTQGHSNPCTRGDRSWWRRNPHKPRPKPPASGDPKKEDTGGGPAPVHARCDTRGS